MPVTDRLSWVFDDLVPMVASAIIQYVAPEIDYPHVIVSTEAVVVHDDYLDQQVFQVQSGDEKLERLVENRYERVLLHLCFPFAQPLTVVDEVDLDIGVCEWEKEREKEREEGGRGGGGGRE